MAGAPLLAEPLQIILTAVFTGVDPGFGQGGPQVLRAKVADVAKRSHAREASNLQPGSQGPLKGPGSFWVFNAQICILPHSRDSFSLIFDIYLNTKR